MNLFIILYRSTLNIDIIYPVGNGYGKTISNPLPDVIKTMEE
ncbi:hypothetical protein [Paenibacillus agricola]|nr:hypothetical protein [Paenibacillus agricola]